MALQDFLRGLLGASNERTMERQNSGNGEPVPNVPEQRAETAPEDSAQQEPASETVTEPAPNVPEQQAETAPEDSAQQEPAPETVTDHRAPSPLINEETRIEAKRCLEQFMSQSKGLHGAIVSSIDGNDLLAALKHEMPTNRLSGMTSSLLALGETVAQESGQKACQFVIVENSAGRVVCLRVNRTLMLTCISSLDMSLGMLLSSGRQTADNLGKVIEKGGI